MPNPKARSIPAPAIPVIVPPSLFPARQQLIAGIAVFASLLAAGSCGLIGHPLRHALTLVSLLAIAAASLGRSPAIDGVAPMARRVAQIALFSLLAAYLSTSSSMVVSALSIVVMLGGVVLAHPDSLPALRPVVIATFVFALYRLAHDSIATVWLISDSLGHLLGRIGSAISGRPLLVGATFAQLDALVLMLAFATGWILQSPSPRLRRGTLLIVTILLGQLLYLVLLARCSTDLLDLKPLSFAGITISFDTLVAQLKDQIHWNLPILAAVIGALVVAFTLRWSRIDASAAAPRRCFPFLPIATAAFAILLPMVCILTWRAPDLTGKTIVFYKKGFLNWMKPQWGDYGRLSQGMYGLMANSSIDMDDGIGGTGSRFLDLYGANAIVSPDLSDADLKKADALVMLYPDKPWQPGQLDRVKKYIDDGGTLLLFGEHTILEPKNDPYPNRPRWPDEAVARFNDLLRDSNMRVRFDAACFTIGGWLQSYESLSHPMTNGVSDDRNEFGVVIGASLSVKWPAQPLIIGRFGNGDPGDEGRPEHALLGNEKYDPGEQLGDVILAAEQRIGAHGGRIVLFGDTSMMSNGLLHGCYDYNARLLAYVSNRTSSPQVLWRQVLSVLLVLALLTTVLLEPHPIRIAACALLLAASISLCTGLSFRHASLIPGRPVESPKNSKLVYTDTSHSEAPSLESWRDNGTMGLALCWERAGYMTLGLEELTGARLYRARALISFAPAKPFTEDERRMIVDWVKKGGIFICTAGYDRSAASRDLLADFGLYVDCQPGEKVREPLGWFKAPFLDFGDYKPHVRFWAAWPLTWKRIEAQPDPQPLPGVALGPGDEPVILKRNFGEGKVVLVGDTNFAMNMNLEREGGQAFEGMRENEDFWRWFIDVLTDADHPWMPTAAATQPATQPSASAQEVTR
jgi:hypothetical protein